MPFYVYERIERENEYIFNKISIFKAIPRRIIKPKLDEIKDICVKDKCGWKLSSDDITNSLISNNSELIKGPKYVLVIDLKPKNREAVSLFQIENIYGYSYKDWTPLCLELREVRDERYVYVKDIENQKNNVKVDKKTFQVKIYEFLYIQMGLESGKLNWGMVGTVNAALLWPDAMRYFIEKCIHFTE